MAARSSAEAHATGDDGSKEFASHDDFFRLRLVQLRELCRSVGLEIGGNKSTLASRLSSQSSWRRSELLALLQTFGEADGNGSERQSLTRVPKRALKKTGGVSAISKKSAAGTVCNDVELRRLLWAIEDHQLLCMQCGSHLLRRQGRFGLFFVCSDSAACKRVENIRPALERLGESYTPMRFIFELEDASHFRVHALGARDVACLRAWISEAGLATADSEPRLDWSVASRGSTVADDAGLGLQSYGVEPDGYQLQHTPERAGFVFNLRDHVRVRSQLENMLTTCADSAGASMKVRLDDLPSSVLRFLEMLQKSRHWQHTLDVPRPPGSNSSLFLPWAHDIINEIIGTNIRERSRAARDVVEIADVQSCTEVQLRDLLRKGQGKSGRILHEWEILSVAVVLFTSSSLDVCKSDVPDHASIEFPDLERWLNSILPGPKKSPPAVLPDGPAIEEADRLFSRALKCATRLKALRPFQQSGVLRTLRLGGRCLIADEMGCGKTPQALAVIAAYQVWPALIICPASMRLAWAEEIETWLPDLLQPRHVHVIFSSNDMLPQSRKKGSMGDIRIVIVSFAMVRLIYENLTGRGWGIAIADESHCLRVVGNRPCSAAKASLALLQTVPRVLLLSGTPSASAYLDVFAQADLLHSGLLGESWHEFSHEYDDPTLSSAGHLVSGRCRRAWQLAFILREATMVRRLKKDVLSELPPKRRRIFRVSITHTTSESLSDAEALALTDYERVGLLKVVSGEDWLCERISSCRKVSQKLVVFAHHISVLDRVCRLAESQDVPLIRIDGSTPATSRQSLIHRFRQSGPGAPVIAVIGVTACAVGVDLSIAAAAIFVELPPDVGWLSQAEDRLHRRGQQHIVDIVVLLAHLVPTNRRSSDEAAFCRQAIARCCASDLCKWRSLQRRSHEVTALHDGPATVSPQCADFNALTADDSVDSLENALNRLEACTDSKDDAPQFLFEASPHTDRLHVYIASGPNPEPIGFSIPPEDLPAQESRLPSCLMEQASEFRSAWSGLTAFHRRLARGEAHTAQTLAERRQTDGLNGSRRRYLLRRHSSNDTDDNVDGAAVAAEQRCEVTVTYTTGRLSGRVLTFFAPLAPVANNPTSCETCLPPEVTSRSPRNEDGNKTSEPSLAVDEICLLCLECKALLDTDLSNSASLLKEPAKGPNGEQITHRLEIRAVGAEVNLFCTGNCRSSYFAKRNGCSIRQQLFELEQGVCQKCGLDCHAALQEVLSAQEGARRKMKLAEVAPCIALVPALADRILTRLSQGAFWEADHIVPVWAGGGACGLENLQTLCVACHRTKTRQEAEKRLHVAAEGTSEEASRMSGISTCKRKRGDDDTIITYSSNSTELAGSMKGLACPEVCTTTKATSGERAGFVRQKCKARGRLRAVGHGSVRPNLSGRAGKEVIARVARVWANKGSKRTKSVATVGLVDEDGNASAEAVTYETSCKWTMWRAGQLRPSVPASTIPASEPHEAIVFADVSAMPDLNELTPKKSKHFKDTPAECRLHSSGTQTAVGRIAWHRGSLRSSAGCSVDLSD